DPVADATEALAASQAGPALLASRSMDGGGVTRSTWTPTGLQLSVTDPTGARTEATYDELGRQLTATTFERHPSPINLTSHYTWNDAGNQTASTTPGGITTRTTYNPAGEPRTVSDPVGTTKFDYDGLGRPTETVDATGRRSTTTFDTLGRTTATTDYGTGTTALRTSTAEYDADGNLTASIPPGTKARTAYAYDALGRMTRQIEPVSSTESITTTFGYDTTGNRTRLTDGRGNTTEYTFNAWGLPEATIEPSTTAHQSAADRTWTTVYDKAARPVTELLPGGVERERAYDGLDRPIHETGTGAEAATTDRTLEYDLAGRLTAIGTADGLTRNTYTYNDRGQLLTANGPGGTSNYAYNADGAMTLRQTKAGTTNYGYDDAGRIDWVWDSITGNDIWYDFDAAGRPSLEQYAAKPDDAGEYAATAKQVYAYDDLGRLSADTVTTVKGATTIASTTYGYDLDDNLTSKKTTGTAGSGTNTYAYDHANRMTSWTKDGTTTSYAWDAAGNRTKAGTTPATFDARNRQLTDGTTTYAYTARGTLTSIDTGDGTPRMLTFDAFERKITDSGTTYTYDSLDRVQTRGSTVFTYDGGSNNLTGDGTTNYSRTPEGALLSLSTGTTKQWALTDQHTDLVAALTPDGTQISGSTAYDPFGTKTATDGTTPALGYQSGWTDPTTGDVNMAARWYQPGTGSFASRDTWQLDPLPSAQTNRYLYANAGPLNGTDPSGHCLGPILVVCIYGLSDLAIGGGLSLAGVSSYQLSHTNTSSWDWSWSWSSSSSSAHAASTSLSQTLAKSATSLANALKAQAIHFGSVSSKGTGSSRAYVSSSPYAQPYYFGQPSHGPISRVQTVVAPPKPPIIQNPNNGPHAKTAPTRPAPKPDWDPNGGKWKPDDIVKLIVGAAQMLDLANNDQYVPDSQADHETAPVNGNSGGTGQRDDPCSKPREERYNYLPMQNGRPVGATALICPSDLKPPGSKRDDSEDVHVAGFPVGNNIDTGGKPIYNRTHIIADMFHGEWRSENLFTGFDRMNKSGMKRCESKIKKQLQGNDPVFYSGLLNYPDSTGVIPKEIRMTAYTKSGKLFDVTVGNVQDWQTTC
ncbi:laminin G, partial [Streptomyces sp. SID2888]|nr:laminin G [Streptomyces sp. SID2888]